MGKESFEQTSKRLNEELKSVRLKDLAGFFDAHREKLITSPRPFADYMRMKFREKGVLQQNVFLAADLSENYGYKLISEEKHTRQRDVILRICLAAKLDELETDEALMLYGMAPLNARIPRDVAFIVAINNHIYDIHEVDAILRENNLPPFLT